MVVYGAGMDEKILIIDDELAIRDLVVTKLLALGYQCECASDGSQGLRLAAGGEYALVLLDVKLPGRDGLQLLKEIKGACQDTSVVMVSSISDNAVIAQALRLGAYEYLVKPFNLERLVITIERALERRRLILQNRNYQQNLESMVQEKTVALRRALEKIEQGYKMTLEALVTALDIREHETQAHSKRVREYTLHLARRVGLSGEELEEIGRGALLHDIGKIGVSDNILLKPGPLNSAEWAEMRKHPEIGARIISGIEFLRPASQIVLEHQEMYDGSGYPQGLAGEQICLGARIFAIADTLDAMTSDRPYRKAVSYEAARREIIKFSGVQFDPKLVEVFLKVPPEQWWQIRNRVK